jgi:hypothetical protein
MEAETPKPKELPYVDRVDVVEAFSDQVRLIHFDGYSVRIEFAVARPRITGPNQSKSILYPVARIALSPLAAAVLGDQLAAVISQLQQQGVLKRLAPSSSKKQ